MTIEKKNFFSSKKKNKNTIVDTAVEALGHHQCVACPAVKCHGVFAFSSLKKKEVILTIKDNTLIPQSCVEEE